MPNQHVVPRNGEWAVKPEGGSKPTSTHRTQKEAIEQARERSRNQGTELIIHRKNGTIREKDSHGRDPHPPKG
jgi:hypothetical protein